MQTVMNFSKMTQPRKLCNSAVDAVSCLPGSKDRKVEPSALMVLPKPTASIFVPQHPRGSGGRKWGKRSQWFARCFRCVNAQDLKDSLTDTCSRETFWTNIDKQATLQCQQASWMSLKGLTSTSLILKWTMMTLSSKKVPAVRHYALMTEFRARQAQFYKDVEMAGLCFYHPVPF